MSKVSFVPRELTVKEQRNLMKANQQLLEGGADVDDYGDNIIPDITMREMSVICGVEGPELFDDLLEGELATLAEKCMKANPRFFGKKKRDREAGEKMMQSNPDIAKRLIESHFQRLEKSKL